MNPYIPGWRDKTEVARKVVPSRHLRTERQSHMLGSQTVHCLVSASTTLGGGPAFQSALLKWELFLTRSFLKLNSPGMNPPHLFETPVCI